MTPTTVRMVLVEGEKADGLTVDHDVFDITAIDGSATPSAPQQVIAAVLGTQESATAGGHQLVATGVTWSDRDEAAALREALALRGIDDVTLFSELHAAGALARAAGRAVGYDKTALMFIERDTATLSVVETSDGSIVKVDSRSLHSADAMSVLAGMVASLEEHDARPAAMFVVGSGVDVGSVKAHLENLVSIPVSAPEDGELALARGAALAAANAPRFEASTVGLAYSQDPDGTTAGTVYAVDPAAATQLAPVGAVAAEAAAADIPGPLEEGRKPFLLVGSSLTAIFVVGVVALVISLAVSIRPTVDQRPSPGDSVILPSTVAPAPQAQPAPQQPPAPETIPAPVPVVQRAPQPQAPAPRAVVADVPPPQAPAPAAVPPPAPAGPPAPLPDPPAAPPVDTPPPAAPPPVYVPPPAPIIGFPLRPIFRPPEHERPPWYPPQQEYPQSPQQQWPQTPSQSKVPDYPQYPNGSGSSGSGGYGPVQVRARAATGPDPGRAGRVRRGGPATKSVTCCWPAAKCHDAVSSSPPPIQVVCGAPSSARATWGPHTPLGWLSSGTRSSASTSIPARSPNSRPVMCRSTNQACERCCATTSQRADCGSPPTTTWQPSSPTCTSSVWVPRRRRASTPPICAMCTPLSTCWCRGCAGGRSLSASPRFPSAPRRSSRRGHARWPRTGWTSKWPGIRSFCGKATRCTTPCIQTGLCSACNAIQLAPRPRCANSTRRCWTPACRFCSPICRPPSW